MELKIELKEDYKLKCDCGGYILPVYKKKIMDKERYPNAVEVEELMWRCTKCDIRIEL